MEEKTIQRLNEINQDFYQTNSSEFNQTRNFFWNGWHKILNLVDKDKKINVLDVGCGNGRFALFLNQNNLNFNYFGCDQSSNLLEIAKGKLKTNKISFDLKNIDLINQLNYLNLYQNKFDLITLFGVWHHIPSENKRLDLLVNLRNLLNENGYLIISFWQFTIDKKLTNRDNTNFDNLGLDKNNLEKNDYLLTWEKGIKKYRYCHFSNLREVKEIANKLNLKIINHYYNDGKNKKMNLYVVLQKN